MASSNKLRSIYRVIDANLNRIREALRVIEEYFRFIDEQIVFAKKAKTIRHSIRDLSDTVDQQALINSRDSISDPFSKGSVAKEMERSDIKSIVVANLKRSQEAARSLEEYIKLLPKNCGSEKAKSIRFTLYTFEKQIFGVD